MTSTFVRAYPPAEAADGPSLWLLFRGSELLVVHHGERLALVEGNGSPGHDLSREPALYLGTLNGVPCLACELADDAPLPDGASAIGLRGLYGRTDEETYNLAGYAAQLLHWRRTSRFCSACGAPTAPVAGDWGRRCTSCAYTAYPRISPAILALIHDGERVLLTHKPGWGARYSLVAGFVEPGESLEGCVHREVFEEVGVRLAEVTYAGSQTWPFPHQLMIGFLAQYAGGEIQIDGQELDDARWFSLDDLPELPAPLSLSRQIIDAWVATHRR